MTQKELKEGKKFFFTNERHQELIGGDDIRGATVLFHKPWNIPSFTIWFNGAIIHSSKTFKSCENRLNKLIEKWHLEPTEEE